MIGIAKKAAIVTFNILTEDLLYQGVIFYW